MTEAFTALPAVADFKTFYNARNTSQYRGVYPAPLGANLVQLQVVMADTIADYMDELRKALLTNG